VLKRKDPPVKEQRLGRQARGKVNRVYPGRELLKMNTCRMVKSNEPLWFLVGAALLILLGAAIRVLTISDSLPFIHHADEIGNLEVAQNMLRTGTANPHMFFYPPFFYYLLVPSQLLIQLASGKLIPFVTQELGIGYTSQPEAFVAARLTIVALGVGIVVSTMMVAKELGQKHWSILLVGALTVFNPLLVAHSRFITPDTPAGLFATLALLGAIRILTVGSTSSYVFAGIMSGLAASSKYNAGMVAISIITSHFMAHRFAGSRLYLLILAGLVSMTTLVLTSPFVILDFHNAIGGILFEIRHYRTGHPGNEGNTVVTNLTWLWNAFGASLLLAPLPAICAKSRRFVLPVAVFVVAYFLLISIQFVRFERNLLPIIPAIIILIGIAPESIQVILSKRVWYPVAASIIVFSLVTSFNRTVFDTAQRTAQRDTYHAVHNWVGQNIAPGASIMLDSYSPFIDPKLYAVTAVVFVLKQPISSVVSKSVVVVSKQGSGRFLHASNSTEHEIFDKIETLACQRQEFESDGVTVFWVFIFKC
jgi:Dolichyl-phosphate-mannose-protein mannosyltransferase